jgi:hypothetical protein
MVDDMVSVLKQQQLTCQKPVLMPSREYAAALSFALSLHRPGHDSGHFGSADLEYMARLFFRTLQWPNHGQHNVCADKHTAVLSLAS